MSGDNDTARQRLRSVLNSVFRNAPDGLLRESIRKRASLYHKELNHAGFILSDTMTRERHERLKRIRKALSAVADELEADRFILNFLDEFDEDADAASGDAEVKASLLLEGLDEPENIRVACRAIDQAIKNNPPSGRQIEKDVRRDFWTDVAFIYEAATARPAAVVKREDKGGTEEGLFVELIQALHTYIEPSAVPPSASQIEHFCDWLRENRDNPDIQMRQAVMRVAQAT